METTRTNTNTQSSALTPGQPNNVNPDDLLLDSVQRAGIAVRPPLPPVFQDPNEKIINDYLRKVMLLAAGSLMPVSLEEQKNFFKALSQVTGRENTEFTRKAVNNFLEKLTKAIESHRHGLISDGYDPTKDFDQNGDGVLDAKDLVKIWKEALLAW